MKRFKENAYLKNIQSLIVAISLMLISGTAYAQVKPVSVDGLVTSSEGDALPGASVIVKGTNNGVVTNLDGKFTIECMPTDTLVVSFVGYLSEEIGVVEGQPIEVVLLEDFTKLGEVVVVGYGTMRKKDITGSISTVSADELHQGVITTTEQALQGRVAGLTVLKGSGDPTSGATMRLRGGTSLSASSSPLVVVDGIPNIDINTIQPGDIESVDVLKDASAAAIYGSQAANGVIMITTKRPKKGGQIEYSSFVAFSKPANYIDVLSADDWRNKVIEEDATSAIDFGSDTDWQKEITQNAISYSHNLSFSNSNEGSGYRAAISYLNNEGVVMTSKLERIGASLTAYTTGLDDKLRLDIGMHSTYDQYNPIDYSVFERALNLNPTAPVKDEDGNYFQVDGTNTENPVEILKNRHDDQTRKRILGFAKADLEIIEGLNATLNTSYDYGTHQGRFYLPSDSRYGQGEMGYGNRSLGDNQKLQLETYITYAKEHLSGHRYSIMAGYSYSDNTYEGFGSERRGFDTDLFLYNNLQAGQDYRAPDVYSYKGKSTLISFFGRVNYSYNGKYSMIATLRRDGSSKFGENNKWGTFPSVSAAWTISEEEFMSSTSGWLNFIKLRGGYGITGSQNAIDPYNAIALWGANPDLGKYYDPSTESWKTAYGPAQNPNEDLKWEQTAQSNIGIDFSLFNKLSSTIEVYNKKTSDLIYTYYVSSTEYIYPTILANVGEMSNKGYEFSLDWKVLNKGDFSWNINLTMAQNDMKIEKLSDNEFGTGPIPSGSLHGIRGMSGQYSQTIREGYAVGTFWGQESSGISEDGEFLNVNGDVLDVSNDSLNTDLGNAQATFTLGLSTGLTYKNFDFSIATYGMFGQKVLNATAMAVNDGTRFPSQNVTNVVFDENISSGSTYSSYWVEDASFFRLQSMTLGYTFHFNKSVDRLRLYATGENLFVLTKYSGLDPEINIERYDNSTGKMDALSNPGIDRFDVYPRARTFSLGLSLSF